MIDISAIKTRASRLGGYQQLDPSILAEIHADMDALSDEVLMLQKKHDEALATVPDALRINGEFALRDTVKHLVNTLNLDAKTARLAEAAAHRDVILTNIPKEFHVEVKKEDGEQDKWAILTITVGKLVNNLKLRNAQAETIAHLCQITGATNLNDLVQKVAVAISQNTHNEEELKDLIGAIPAEMQVSLNGKPDLSVTIDMLVKRAQAKHMPEYPGSVRFPHAEGQRIADQMRRTGDTIDEAIEEVRSHEPAPYNSLGSPTFRLYEAFLHWEQQARQFDKDLPKMMDKAGQRRLDLITSTMESIASTIRLHKL